ncbi:MAG TPA: AMP-binding protein, partial [Candidatus Saccharimonadales bacterium]|nr:AMP-binding protein [Candidatus Saccharimonadales bacterium]
MTEQMNHNYKNFSVEFTEKSLLEIIQTKGLIQADHNYLEDARSDKVVTYGQLASTTDKWSSLLKSKKIAPRSSVLLDISDPVCFGVIHLSLIANGMQSVPVDPDSPWCEIERLAGLVDDGVQLIISDRRECDVFSDIPIIDTDELGRPGGDYKSIKESVIHQSHNSTLGSIIVFTSGSTGKPKGVELTEKQLLYVAREISKHNKLQTSDRGFNSLPLFHVNAEVVGLLSTLVAGATLVLDRRFHRTNFWELLEERRITWMNSVPAILALLSRGVDELHLPKTLRFIRSASAPLPDVVRDFFSDIELVVSYGMTESASQITATPLGQPRRPGSVGLPIGNELEIRDSKELLLPTNEVGDVWIRGPGIIKSYLFERANERFDAEGWLNTGDIGKVDKDGYVYLMGRSDDVINRGGEKLYPAEIEDVLLEDNRVLEAIVAAREDDILGQVPVAYIIPVDDDSDAYSQLILYQALVKKCDKSLTRFKRPVEIIVTRDLPRAATGKIQRVP